MGEAPQTYTVTGFKGKKALLDGHAEPVSVLPKETVIEPGDEIRGWLNPEGKWGPYLKIAEERSGPRIESTTNKERGSAGGTDTVRPDAAAKRADSGGEPWWDERDRRIQWSWAINAANAQLAPSYQEKGEPIPHDEAVARARIILAQSHEELSSQQNKSPTAHQPTTGEAAPDKGTDTPPPPASDNRPVTPQQKGKVTQALNASPIAKQHHDTLRAWYGADRVDGARKLWKALSDLDSGQVPAFLTQHGITPASDVPLDDEDLPTTQQLEARARNLGMEVVED